MSEIRHCAGAGPHSFQRSTITHRGVKRSAPKDHPFILGCGESSVSSPEKPTSVLEVLPLQFKEKLLTEGL
ncbi:hypothetical protein RRG08_052510 [Elysia crispata]|uniref:Uncharacterized protein n=1 Tax=Elysia crispata TaxID=231223 RepID=A0AAE1DG07_9GAST|nr:hypothetical protein RRG08_052510 [Elysia crispata]